MSLAREVELTADRLRQLSDARLAAHAEAVYALLEGMTERDVPRLSPRAWADQLLLISGEVDGGQEFVEPVRQLRRRFDLTL